MDYRLYVLSGTGISLTPALWLSDERSKSSSSWLSRRKRTIRRSSLNHAKTTTQWRTAHRPTGRRFHGVLKIMDLRVLFSSKVDEINPLDCRSVYPALLFLLLSGILILQGQQLFIPICCHHPFLQNQPPQFFPFPLPRYDRSCALRLLSREK